MTTDVTTLRPQIDHFDSCDRDVYGRAVAWYMQGDPELLTAENLREFVAGYRGEHPRCECLAFRIRSAEDEVRLAKLAFNACMSEANAERAAVAKAELARLRGMQ